MKKFIVVVSIISFSCGGGSGNSEVITEPIVNKAPSVPSLVNPINNLLCLDKTVAFQWSASTDPEDDTISYKIEVATDAGFTQIVENLSFNSTSSSILLENDTAYYWRVKAIDSKSNSSSYSNVFKFYTYGIGVTNYLPFAPELVKPTLNFVVQTPTATLEWTASDVDTGDVLTYDVYLDTSNPPTTKIGDNITIKTSTDNVSSSTTYYWRVVVKDDKGGMTEGQVWNFKTN